MFLLYLDASGNPDQSDRTTKHYVLLGVAIQENTWFALDKRIRSLKNKYAYPGEDFELHATDFCRSINAQGKIPGFERMNLADRRANVEELWGQKERSTPNSHKRDAIRSDHRRMRPFAHLLRAERSSLYENALDLVGGHRGVILFGEAIEKDHPAVTTGKVDCVQQAFAQVITRFDAFLKRRAAWRGLGRTGRVQSDKGMIVMDRDLQTEREIERQFAGYKQSGHPWGQLEFVVDAPFFVDSRKVAGIQIGDICAYALRRYLDKGAVTDSHEEKQFLRIYHSFDRSRGKLHGLRHYVQGGKCSCIICRERGHTP